MPDLSINDIAATSRNARVLRGLNEFGMNLADFFALTTNSRFDAFGNGTGYTVQNWINDGVFPNLAAVQAVYPIVQAATDKVDWVGLQTAWDFMIYGALGNGIRGQMKRELLIPAGHYVTTGHKLEIGYATLGTPPASLNGNGYVQLSVRGEGSQYDPSGNGMTGTTIVTDNTTEFGINVNRGLDIKLEGFTLKGPYDNWMESNVTNLYKGINGWDINTFRRTSPPVANANWIGGAAVNIGVGQSLYTDAASAAAYPPRVLPSYFGGGTTVAQTGSAGGSGLYLQDVNIRGFIIGFGRPYGDQNDEYIRFHGGTIQNCVKAVVTRHSQNRNMSFRDCRIEGCHTAFSNKGGLAADGGNANMHGAYDNIHFGRLFQIFDHDNGGWTGPITLRNCYAESVMSIGRLAGRPLILDGTQISFIEQENNVGVAPTHFQGTKLVLTNGSLIGIMRHGLMLGGHTTNDPTQVVIDKGSTMDTHITRSSPGGSTFNGDPNLAQIRQGFEYMRHVFALPGRGVQILNDRDVSEYGPNLVSTNRTDEIIDTHLQQEWTQFYPQHPIGAYPDLPGSQEMQGVVKRFSVPKITRWQQPVTVSSRSGLDITCPRIQNGAIKADVGDMFMFDPGAPDTTRAATWFVCRAISGSNMILRQLNNFFSTNGTDYQSNGWNQVNAGWSGNCQWICTRIKQNHRYWIGDVTNGSNVITNVKHGFRFGTTDEFTTGCLGMQIGDIFLHQEDERSNTGGAGLSVQNIITGIDFTANTITLTNNFNVTRNNYPIVFFVKVFNA